MKFMNIYKKKFNKLVKNTFKALGINISRINKVPKVLNYHQIELLLDVGANDGGFARLMRSEGYDGKIVSFEPLPEAYQKLINESKNDTNWIIHERCAIGSEIGEAQINISKNSYSSSLLPMLESHLSAEPNSINIGKANTKVITLDSILDVYRNNNQKTFLKIDTQGYEKEVLNGIKYNLKNIYGVQLELSIVHLYENQEIYKYFFTFFEENNFSLWSILPGFYNPLTGQTLQFDAIFIRSTYK